MRYPRLHLTQCLSLVLLAVRSRGRLIVSEGLDTHLGRNQLWTGRLPLQCCRLQRCLPQSLISLLGGAGASLGLLRRARLQAEEVAH